MKLIKFIFAAMVAFCVATVVVQGAGLALLWKQGALSEGKFFQLVAVVQDVDISQIKREIEEANKPSDAEQIAHEEVVSKRADKDLNLHLRESATEKALSELRQLQAQLQGNWERYNKLTEAFQKELNQQGDDAVARGRQNLVRLFESTQPKLAKDQIIRILKEDDNPDGLAMADVVRIFKATQRDKIKKIVGEFKTEEEKNQLHEILRQIRMGEPEVSLIRETQGKLPGE